MPQPFTGAVLAGGRSRRMGTDKALIELEGKPLVVHAVDALRAAGAAEILIVGRPPEFAESIEGARSIPDSYPDEGPLGGLLTAMEHATTNTVILSPCDLVEAAAEAIIAVVDGLGDADVALPFTDHHGHFVQAGFRSDAYPHLRGQFDAGERSIRLAIADLDVHELRDGQPSWFHDADAPDELPPGVHLNISDATKDRPEQRSD